MTDFYCVSCDDEAQVIYEGFTMCKKCMKENTDLKFAILTGMKPSKLK